MQNTTRYAKYFKPFILPFSALVTTAILATGGITAYSLWQDSQTEVKSNSVTNLPKIKTVTALGRIEPSGEIVQVSASSSERVEKLRVKKGDRVAQGQIIAILDSRDHAAAELKQAEEQVRVAEANLAQVKAGAKTGEIEAQKAALSRIGAERRQDLIAQDATVASLSAKLENARVEYQRYQQLYANGAISASERDSKQLALETAQQQLEEAKANLNKTSTAKQEQIQEAKATLKGIAEVRPVDVDVVAAQVKEAQAAVATAQAQLDKAYIKTPQAGQILDILTQPGELVSSDGIARIGQTDRMYAVAEIYESDIGKIRVGQQASVTSNAFSAELHGTVEQIGLEIQRQEVVNTDPTANIDAKIVEAKIRLDERSSQKVAGLSNLLINVKITL